MSENYTKGIQRLLKIAKEESLKIGHSYVGSEHLLLAIIKDSKGSASNTLIAIGCNIEKMQSLLKESLTASNVTSTLGHLPLTRRAERILKNSFIEAKNDNRKSSGQNDLLLSMLLENDCTLYKIFNLCSVDYQIIKSYVTSSNNIKIIHKKKYSEPDKESTLKMFSRNISDLASSGKLDPVIGRNEEIERLSQILSRRKKNNPVLIGEPGVGKTAIVEGLALRILDKKVPRLLWDYTLISLDIPGMLAGTKYRGQFEERMRKMMQEIEKSSNIILFIDELHTIVGAGSAAGSLDAANMLKPALARGDIQIVGATTLSEYRKYIESDGALDRRFQKIIVYQPSIKSTVDILNGIKDKYELHHKVKISKDAISACVELSDRYINDRFLPDKAIDIMDEVCSRISLNSSSVPDSVIKLEKKLKLITDTKNKDIINQHFENAAKLRDKEKKILNKIDFINNQLKLTSVNDDMVEITDKDVADTVSLISGIPISKINERESVKILSIKDNITKFIVGQDYAVDKLVSAIQRSRSGFKNPNHPIGSFMFLGPTGVGKTELAKQLAHSLFNKKESLIKIDMSEYMERYNVSRLIGAPPGYVGYEEGGFLSEKVRRNPYSIVLFDEIEKAHTDVFNILLQILDEGRLTDSLGHVIDFSNTIIILTSNIGTQSMSSSTIGFNKSDEKDLKIDLQLEVKKYFKPELLNRLDETIIFNSLNKDNLFDIIDLQLNDLRKNLKSKNMSLRISKSAKNILLINGIHREWGARPIRRIIQNEIENVISFKYLNGEIEENSIIYINGKGSQLIFKSKNKKLAPTSKA
ncbi:MAG: Clp protease ClpC [Candidatus Marinimicrobia bacterium]|nr:Clp protease ClpC [Candidatus Neomarinimicrobiota bacterium]